ncbi:hypothetical protein ABPG74_001654 [Tetrahymena malaccensis]
MAKRQPQYEESNNLQTLGIQPKMLTKKYIKLLTKEILAYIIFFFQGVSPSYYSTSLSDAKHKKQIGQVTIPTNEEIKQIKCLQSVSFNNRLFLPKQLLNPNIFKTYLSWGM